MTESVLLEQAFNKSDNLHQSLLQDLTACSKLAAAT